MPCKFGENTPALRNSSDWQCTYPIPLSMVAPGGRVNYTDMKIFEGLCTEDYAGATRKI